MRLWPATRKMFDFSHIFLNFRVFSRISPWKTYILGRIFSNFAEIEEEDEGFPEETQKNEVFQHLTEEKLSAMRKELEDLEGKSQKRLDIYQKRNKKFKELLSECETYCFFFEFPYIFLIFFYFLGISLIFIDFLWISLISLELHWFPWNFIDFLWFFSIFLDFSFDFPWFFFDFRGKHLKNEAQFQEFKAKLIEENLYAGDHPFFCEDSPFYLSTDDGFLKEVPKQLGGFDGAMDNFIVFQL